MPEKPSQEDGRALERGIIRAEGFLSGVSKKGLESRFLKYLAEKTYMEPVPKMASLGVFDQVFEDYDVNIPPPTVK